MDEFTATGRKLIRDVYSANQLKALQDAVASLGDQIDSAVRQNSGAVYAARNILDLVPSLATIWKTDQLVECIHEILGDRVGLVRGLFFDKPPEQTWALPWHKDLLIAVANSTGKTDGYSAPRLRAGVLHTEPPVEVLESMLTLRVHLDPMTDENGPLRVLPGSHRTGKSFQIDGFDSETIHANAGDTLLMRPLLVHASGRSLENSTTNRRVLHLEFSGMPNLPGGVQWHRFVPIENL